MNGFRITITFVTKHPYKRENNKTTEGHRVICTWIYSNLLTIVVT